VVLVTAEAQNIESETQGEQSFSLLIFSAGGAHKSHARCAMIGFARKERAHE
jgi:hypothetical protein